MTFLLFCCHFAAVRFCLYLKQLYMNDKLNYSKHILCSTERKCLSECFSWKILPSIAARFVLSSSLWGKKRRNWNTSAEKKYPYLTFWKWHLRVNTWINACPSNFWWMLHSEMLGNFIFADLMGECQMEVCIMHFVPLSDHWPWQP